MREYISIVEGQADFSRAREEKFYQRVNDLHIKAADLAREIKALDVAPSIQAKLDASTKVVTDYLKGLADHAAKNLR